MRRHKLIFYTSTLKNCITLILCLSVLNITLHAVPYSKRGHLPIPLGLVADEGRLFLGD